MRVIYNYVFDITKKLKRNELISFVLQFIEKNDLTYDDVLFDFYTYKDYKLMRKSYFEKLCEKDKFWDTYKNEYECGFVKNTNVVGVSNLEKGEWVIRNIEDDNDRNIIISKLEEQLDVMPRYNYKIVFNNIKWYGVDNSKKVLISPGVPRLYPLSSSITIMNTFPQKTHIVLSFEMCNELKEHRLYVESFLEASGCSYIKEVQFVRTEEEQEKNISNSAQVNKLLRKIEDTKICIENTSYQNKSQLHVKKVLEDVFCEMTTKYEGNGVYEVYLIDENNNKLVLCFDYEREYRSLCATLAYKGMGYKYGVRYSELKAISCDEVIRQYAIKVRCEMEMFMRDYVPQIIKLYEPMPDWYDWE